jgi:hypothetical protein
MDLPVAMIAALLKCSNRRSSPTGNPVTVDGVRSLDDIADVLAATWKNGIAPRSNPTCARICRFDSGP